MFQLFSFSMVRLLLISRSWQTFKLASTQQRDISFLLFASGLILFAGFFLRPILSDPTSNLASLSVRLSSSPWHLRPELQLLAD